MRYNNNIKGLSGLPGYMFEKLSLTTVVLNAPPVVIYRVKDQGVNQLAKTSNSYDPKENKKLDNEIQILSNLFEFYRNELHGSSDQLNFRTEISSGIDLESLSKVPNVSRYQKQNDQMVLLLRDSGLVPLRSLYDQLSMLDITKIMYLAADTLAFVHHAKIAHLNVNPDCFLIKKVPLDLELIDFRNSVHVGELGANYYTSIDTDARYISPEQSGRVNKKIDGRSDIYSLGITFWELLTGEHPFPNTENEHLIYYHIAKKIPDAHSINPKIPIILSNIIRKMISKDRSERYQDIEALKYDLGELIPDKSLSGRTLDNDDYFNYLLEFENFQIASRDKTNLLSLKEETIRRPEAECILLHEYEKEKNRLSSFVVLRGKAKSGKRSLVMQLAEHVQTDGGSLIICEPKDEKSPKNPFLFMIDVLSKSILSKGSDTLLSIRNSLLQGIGRDNLAILIKWNPKIQSIMGPGFNAHTDQEISTKKALPAFKRFLNVLFSIQKTVLYFPRILADQEGIEILHFMAARPMLNCMFIITTDNNKPMEFQALLNEINSDFEGNLLLLDLPDLTPLEISTYLSSILVPTKGNLEELSLLLYSRCAGSPFHLKALILQCSTNRYFSFDNEQFAWTWNISELKSALKISENVALVLAENVVKLEENKQLVLHAAALLGLNFESQIVQECFPEISDMQSIFKQLEDDLYITQSSSPDIFEFSSPLIRSTIFKFLKVDEKAVICTKLALSIEKLDLRLSSEDFRDFLQSFYESLPLLADRKAIFFLFKAHLDFAERSRKCMAINQSLRHLEIAYKTYQKDPEAFWTYERTLLFKMLVEYSKFLLQSQNFDTRVVSKIVEELESRISDKLEELQVLSVKLNLLKFQSDYETLADICKTKLQLYMDFDLKTDCDSQEQYLLELKDIIAKSGMTPQQMLSSSLKLSISSENMLLREIMFLYSISLQIVPSYTVDNKFVLQACIYDLNNGCNEYSCAFFSSVIRFFVQENTAVDLGIFKWISDFSMLLLESSNRSTKAATFLSAMKGMDLVWIAPKMITHVKDYLDQFINIRSPFTLQCIEIFQLYSLSIGIKVSEIERALKLFGSKVEENSFMREYFEPPHYFDLLSTGECLESNHKGFRYLKEFMDLLFTYLFGFRDDKETILGSIPSIIQNSFTMTAVVDTLLFKCLILIELKDDEEDEEKQEQYTAEIESSISRIEWLTNIQGAKEQRCKYFLVYAEYQRLKNNVSTAMDKFEECIDAAQNGKNLFIEALASELYGAMLVRLKSKHLSAPCLQKAIKLWGDYGSDAKARQLETKYFQVFQSYEAALKPKALHKGGRRVSLIWDSAVRSTVKQASSKREEMSAILEVSASLNQEKNLESLLENISNHILTHTNATKAVILLEENDRLFVNAITNLNDDGKIAHDPNIYDPEQTMVAPITLANYVWRSGEKIIPNDLTEWDDSSFKSDDYIRQFHPKSLACIPIIYHDKVSGVVYIENSLQKKAFTTNGIELVQSFFATTSVAIENARLKRMNEELANELESKIMNATPKVTFDSPIQKVIESLQLLKTKFEFDPVESRNITQMVNILNSDDLFKANLDFEDGMDQDTKKWVESTLLQADTKNLKVNVQKEMTSEASLSSSFEQGGDVRQYLEKTEPMSFDIFRFSELTSGAPLHYMAMYLCNHYQLFQSLNIEPSVASSFFQKIESSYNNLPYHNSTHGADLLNSVRTLFLETTIQSKFTALEIAGLIIGGAIHDVDHPGVNNSFLLQAHHPLAILYNDTSILESHHAAFGFEIARDHAGCNIFQGLENSEFIAIRKLIIQYVLATDLAQHFQILNKFKAKISQGNLKLEEATDRAMVLEMAIKCSDLSNPTRPLDQSVKWSYKVMEEFFNQGEREKLLGIPVSQFMDKSTTNIPKCQVGFIDFLVAPLYDVWSLFSNTPFTQSCIQNIMKNRDSWKQWQDNPTHMPPFPQRATRIDKTLDMNLLTNVKFGSTEIPTLQKIWSIVSYLDANSQPNRKYGSGVHVVKAAMINNPPTRTHSSSTPVESRTPDEFETKKSFKDVVQSAMRRSLLAKASAKPSPVNTHTPLPEEAPIIINILSGSSSAIFSTKEDEEPSGPPSSTLFKLQNVVDAASPRTNLPGTKGLRVTSMKKMGTSSPRASNTNLYDSPSGSNPGLI